MAAITVNLAAGKHGARPVNYRAHNAVSLHYGILHLAAAAAKIYSRIAVGAHYTTCYAAAVGIQPQTVGVHGE